MHAPWDMVVAIVVAVLGSSGLWSYLEHKSGRLGQIEESIRALTVKLDKTQEKNLEQAAEGWQSQIIRFDGDMKRHMDHTFEEFQDIIKIIDEYDAYQKNSSKSSGPHPKKKETDITISKENILAAYKTLKETRQFL